MTPDETSYFELVGNGMVMNLNILTQVAIFYGIYIVLAIAALSSLWQRKYRGCHPHGKNGIWSNFSILILLLVITFCLMTVDMAIWISSIVGTIKDRFTRNLDLPFEDRMGLASLNANQASIPLNWISGQGGLLFVVGDAAVVWRAWIISFQGPYRVYLISIPLFFLVASFAFSFASSVLLTQEINAVFIAPESVLGILANTWTACSLATNLSATALIGWRAYVVRKSIVRSIGPRKSVSWKVLLYMVETGVAYCIIQVIYIALQLTIQEKDVMGPMDYALHFITNLLVFAAGSYPSILILLIARGKALANEDSDLYSVDKSRGRSIVFASGPDMGSSSTQMGDPESCVESDPTGHGSGGRGFLRSDESYGGTVSMVQSQGLQSAVRISEQELGEKSEKGDLNPGT